MMPKNVSSDFTPFPLPKYDPSMGYGPVRLQNVPDIERSKQRRERSAAVGLMEEEDGAESTTELSPVTDNAVAQEGSSSSAHSGYQVLEKNFPIVDRIVCTRETDDLIEQFKSRPDVVARSATILDFASSLTIRSDEDLVRMLYEVSRLFTPDGNGLNFIKNVVIKYGRGYAVNNELTTAYIQLVDALETLFAEEQPDRLANPELFSSVLNFLSLIKVFEPNKWYTANPNTPSNRADYRHPRGVNRTISFQRVGEELFDQMVCLLLNDHETGGKQFLEWCTLSQLIDLLGGFAAVGKDGLPDGEVKHTLMQTIDAKLRASEYTIRTRAELEEVERLFLTLALCDIHETGLLHFLLADRERFPESKLSLAEPLSDHEERRGPDFFSAVAKVKDETVKNRTVELFVLNFRRCVAEGDQQRIAALVESGTELFLTLRDKKRAAAIMADLQFDYYSIAFYDQYDGLARRLRHEQEEWTNKRLDLNRFLVRTQEKLASFPPTKYVDFYEGRRIRPIQTFLTNLKRINEIDNVFLLHSSSLEKEVDSLLSVVRRLHSGKDALLITSSCLRNIVVKSKHARREKERAVAQRALEIVRYEMEAGTVVFVPPTEEVLLHDAGVYCDEDLLLWTFAAYFAREMPLVKVHALISKKHPAIRPQRTC
ncbi:hypothetical protein AGDE_09616 [Angomonas deanei]|uniref:Uncharacterized protein n=1 Tax=Angomonas deanei TaxID=59799 RepID=A0A7G2C8R5_9TRYP|nr:hypothetical protein AGDE_09616 [Angomonas deanei]CAD2215514.1 hypothetical protein, conserved [Angomonas deanei]|eukprot:EPY30093.1 hypothetical protein AGDE_09616 [Angomonas deanei]